MKNIIIWPIALIVYMIGLMLRSLEPRIVEIEKVSHIHHLYWPKPKCDICHGRRGLRSKYLTSWDKQWDRDTPKDKCPECWEGRQYLWMRKPLNELGKKHLHNIIAAIFRGTWVNGNEARIGDRLKWALIQEYNSRNITDADIIAIEEANAAYEVRGTTGDSGRKSRSGNPQVDSWFRRERRRKRKKIGVG